MPPKPSVAPSLADMNNAFHDVTLQRGADYAHRGAVSGLEVTDAGAGRTALRGEVAGGALTPYQVSVDVTPQGGVRHELSSRCSCPVGYLCKHAAALLFCWQPGLRMAFEAESAGAGLDMVALRALLSPVRRRGLQPSESMASRLAEPATAFKAGAAADGAAKAGTAESNGAGVPAAKDPRLAWIDRLAATLARDQGQAAGTGSAAAADEPRQFIYALSLDDLIATACIGLCLGQASKPGRLLKVQSMFIDLPRLIAEPPPFATPEDVWIARALSGLERGRGGSGYRLAAAPADLFARLLATGRVVLDGDPSRPLKAAPARRGVGKWTLDAQGNQRFTFESDAVTRALAVPEPWLIDFAKGTASPLASDLPAAVASALLLAPPLPSALAAAAAESLRNTLAAFPETAKVAPLPRAVSRKEVFGKGVVHLRLTAAAASASASPFGAQAGGSESGSASGSRSGSGSSREAAVLASLAIDGVRTPLVTEPFEWIAEDMLWVAEPDATQVRKTLATLAAAGIRLSALPEIEAVAQPDESAMRLDPAHAVGTMQTALPAWRKAGWKISISQDFPWQLTALTDIDLEITETQRARKPQGKTQAHSHVAQDDGLIQVEPWLMIGEQRVALLPILQSMLQMPDLVGRAQDSSQGEGGVHVRIDAQRVVELPWKRVRPILQTLLELHADRATKPLPVEVQDDAQPPEVPANVNVIQLSRFEAPLLARLAADNVGTWKGAPSLRDVADRLAGFTGVPQVEPPAALRAELRPYQREGLSWLQFLRSHGLSGLLADDMGLGKTVQTLAHIVMEHSAGRLTQPALIVAPTSLVHNWVAEAAKFAPTLRVLKLHGSARHDGLDRMSEHDLVVTSYALLPRDAKWLQAQPFHLIVLDEAQAVKNARTLAAKAVRQLSANQRIALTGTPIENNLDELWAQFDVLAPGLLGDRTQFNRLWRTPIEKRGDSRRARALSQRVRPFMLRRTKDAVASDLPPRTEIERLIELHDDQRDLYEAVRAGLEARVQAALAERGLARSQIVVLDALLKLRQVCCDPRLVKLAAARRVQGSAKLEALFDLLGSLLAEGRKVLVFSQFTSMLALIEERLRAENQNYALLTGDTRDRAAQVERFQSGKVRLFLLSLKAGGTGLNLTAADTVIHYDPWWNPAAEQQATDRAHRIGQDKPVFVYRLIAAGTVEERIKLMQARKSQLAQSLLDDADAALAKALDGDDIAALLSPLSAAGALAED